MKIVKNEKEKIKDKRKNKTKLKKCIFHIFF